jgi:hypothetical protein
MFTGRAKPIRITSLRISVFLLYLQALLGFDKTKKREKNEEKLIVDKKTYFVKNTKFIPSCINVSKY